MEVRPTWAVWRLVFVSNFLVILVIGWRGLFSSLALSTVGFALLGAFWSSSLVLLGILAYSRDRDKTGRVDSQNH